MGMLVLVREQDILGTQCLWVPGLFSQEFNPRVRGKFHSLAVWYFCLDHPPELWCAWSGASEPYGFSFTDYSSLTLGTLRKVISTSVFSSLQWDFVLALWYINVLLGPEMSGIIPSPEKGHRAYSAWMEWLLPPWLTLSRRSLAFYWYFQNSFFWVFGGYEI